MSFVRNGDFTNLTFNPGLYNNIGAIAGYPGPSSNIAAAMSDPGPYLGQGGGRRRKNSRSRKNNRRRRQRTGKRSSRKMRGGTVSGVGNVTNRKLQQITQANSSNFLDAVQGSEFPQVYSGGRRKTRRNKRKRSGKKSRRMKGGSQPPGTQYYGYAGTAGESMGTFAGSGYPLISRGSPTDCVVNPTTESGGSPITETVRGQIGGKRRSKRNKKNKRR